MHRSVKLMDLTKLSKSSQGYESGSFDSCSSRSQESEEPYLLQRKTFMPWRTPQISYATDTTYSTTSDKDFSPYHQFGFPPIDANRIYESMAADGIKYRNPVIKSRFSINLEQQFAAVQDESCLFDTSPPASAPSFDDSDAAELDMNWLDKSQAFVDSYRSFYPDASSTPVVREIQMSQHPLDLRLNYKDKAPPRKEVVAQSKKRKIGDCDKENQPDSKKSREKASAVRKLKSDSKPKGFCSYCKENGEPSLIYNHHTLVDAKGRTLCPVLRQTECQNCKADGDNAHTIENCPGAVVAQTAKRFKMARDVNSVRRHLSFLHI